MTNEKYLQIPSINDNQINKSGEIDDLKDDEYFLTFEEYMKKQLEIIRGQENRDKTESAYGHVPSEDDLAQYFVDSGQAEKFCEKYHKFLPKKAS